jgi:phospholipid/cholesterol/gamma-HCH transport system substrate-binding protein
VGTDTTEPENGSWIARVAVVAALGLAVLVAAWLLLGGGDGYVVKAQFRAVSTLVPGNVVKIAGDRAGTVKDISLTKDGLAEVRMEVDDEFAPLRDGTRATIRQQSLSGSASRYVDLRIPPAGGAEIGDGGVIDTSDTSTDVDLDQFFDMFDERTRAGLRNVIRGAASQYAGRSAEAAAGWRYLNPSLVAATRLFREIDFDSDVLRKFLISSSHLVGDVAERRDDVSALVDRLADVTGAIASQETDLSLAIHRLPPFMRRANSTFVNLRATLDDLDPLVEASKPVTPRLRAVLHELRPFARDAKPTVRDLADLARRPGAGNDLLELARAVPPFRDIALGPVQRNGREREGSFPTITKSLRQQTPHFAFFRPYAVDFTGWLDDFSHSGIYDANGAASRIATSVNAFASVGSQLKLVPQELRDDLGNALVRSGQTKRCPGASEHPAEDASNPWKPLTDFNCDPAQLLPGD